MTVLVFLALGLAVCALGDAAAFCLTVATHPFSRPTPRRDEPGTPPLVPSPARGGAGAPDEDDLGAWIANHWAGLEPPEAIDIDTMTRFYRETYRETAFGARHRPA